MERSSLPLPGRVFFQGPGDGSPNGANSIDSFPRDATGGWIIFNVDGSAVADGAIRFADQRGNFLETRVNPRATARVAVRKYKPGVLPSEDWHEQGQGGVNWDWE